MAVIMYPYAIDAICIQSKLARKKSYIGTGPSSPRGHPTNNDTLLQPQVDQQDIDPNSSTYTKPPEHTSLHITNVNQRGI